MLLTVTLPGIFQTFFMQDTQCFVQGIQGIDRRRMMIGTFTLTLPVTENKTQIQEPGLALGLTLTDFFHRRLIKSDGR